MKFNPSIHVKKSDLITLFKKYDFPIKYIDNFLADAAKVSCNNRSVIYASNQRMLKAFYNKVDISKELVFKFNGLLVPLLKERFKGKRQVNKINQSSVQYKTLKEVTVLALEFCEVYNLEAEPGFLQYLKIGFELIGKNYRLNKFIYKHSEIIDYYADVIAIQNDSNKKISKKLHKLYSKKILEIKGFKTSYFSVQDFVNFVYAAEEVVKVKGSPKVWIEAQFEELKFLDIIPALGSLHGPKAQSRYEKYCIKTDYKKEPELSKEQLKFIKSLKKSRKNKELPIIKERSIKDIQNNIAKRIAERTGKQ